MDRSRFFKIFLIIEIHIFLLMTLFIFDQTSIFVFLFDDKLSINLSIGIFNKV